MRNYQYCHQPIHYKIHFNILFNTHTRYPNQTFTTQVLFLPLIIFPIESVKWPRGKTKRYFKRDIKTPP